MNLRSAFVHVAVVDIGSNSVRLVIYRVDPDGTFQEAENVKRTLALGGRLLPDGTLDPVACAELTHTLARFAEVCQAWQVKDVEAVATAVFRQAADGRAVLDACEPVLGYPIRLLAGVEEAAYGSLAVNRTMTYPYALAVDLGGASVEVTAIRDGQPAEAVSLPIGAVNLTRRFCTDGPGAPPPAALANLRAELTAVFAAEPWIADAPGPLIGMGGTSRSIASAHQGKRLAKLLGNHHHVVPREELLMLADRLAAADLETRAGLADVTPDRGALIVAGTEVFRALMGKRRDRLIVCGVGLREGLMFARRPAQPQTRPAEAAIAGAEDLLNYYGGDLAHARRVRALALSLFESGHAAAGTVPDPKDFALLGTAATLADLGRQVALRGAELHTYQLVLRTPLPGVTAIERAQVASIAGFRSGKSLRSQLDELKHLLAPADAARCELLGAIVRVAAALDGTRRGTITQARIRAAHGGLELVLTSAHADLLELDLVAEPLQRYAKAAGCQVRPVLSPEIKAPQEI